MSLADRINRLLGEVAAPGDGSLFDSAMRDRFPNTAVPATPTELAYLRVEILLAAWEELHREAAPRTAALERIAASYPWVPYTPHETIHDRGEDPTNRRVARETLRTQQADNAEAEPGANALNAERDRESRDVYPDGTQAWPGSEESARAAIRSEVAGLTGEWEETHEGSQILFHERTPVRGLPRGTREWCIDALDVLP